MLSDKNISHATLKHAQYSLAAMTDMEPWTMKDSQITDY